MEEIILAIKPILTWMAVMFTIILLFVMYMIYRIFKSM